MDWEIALFLVGLVALAVPVALLYCLVALSRLRGRVTVLERRLVETTQAGAAALGRLQAEVERGGAAPAPDTADKPDKAPETPKQDAARVAARVEDVAPVVRKPVVTELKAETPEVAGSSVWGPSKSKSGDAVDAPAAPAQPAAPRRDWFGDALDWVVGHWFYVVSAISLALAGIFLVQYGVENGMLPPTVRVLAACLFGAALIGGGEYVRRRFGDGVDATTAYLPSVFSGAGIVTLFGAILAARHLYGLIGPEAALGAGVGVALGAVVLGWFHGPLLVAVGVIGAMVAPFVVGGSSDDPSWLFGYYAVIAFLGLAVDTVRRWGWVSVLSLVLAYGAGWMVWAAGPSGLDVGYALFLGVMVVMGTVIPVRRLVPAHEGAMLLEGLRLRRPDLSVLMAGGAMVASAVGLVFIGMSGEFWLSLGALMVLFLAAVIWARGAAALEDWAVWPAGGMVLVLLEQMVTRGAVWRGYFAERAPEVAAPWDVSILLVGAGVVSGLAAWRSLGAVAYPVIWGLVAVLFAPAVGGLLEWGWQPSPVIGAFGWALHALAVAALMVVLAERYARADGEDRVRVALAVMSALSCVAFGVTLLFSDVALTVALAAVVLAAAALDRLFRLPLMEWFIAAGVVVLGYRAVVDPGLFWAEDAPIWELFLGYGSSLGALIGGLWVLRGMDRVKARVMLDSGAWSIGGVFASILMLRGIEAMVGPRGIETHWSAALFAAIWLTLAVTQVQRLTTLEGLRKLRIGLAAVFGAIGVLALLGVVFGLNPLMDGRVANHVRGPVLINTLLVAYGAPVAVVLLAMWRIPAMSAQARLVGMGASLALGALWAFSAIRHLWRGAEGMVLATGFSQPELYSYTVALLVLGAAVFYQSLARRSDLLRRVGLVVIGLAVVKVFFVDIGELDGLTRVLSLAVLGLGLAGLAWLDRWAKMRLAEAPEGADDPAD